MANIAVGFQLTANAAGMSQGINAGVVELQKLGLAAKQTAGDVRVLTGLQLGTAFVSAVRSVATSFTQFTAGAAASIDSTNKLSRALGVSFGELQRLQLAADLSGASSEQLANAFTRAQVTITKAAQGSPEAARGLRQLGLSVQELQSLSSTQQFEAIATAIARIESPAARAAAAVAIFGRSGAQLLPTFQELGSNLQRADNFFSAFRNQLSAADASRIEEINDSFTETRRAVTETAGLLLSRLQPALTAGAKAVQQFLQRLDIDRAAAGVARALESMSNAASLLTSALGPLLQRPLAAIVTAFVLIKRQAIATVITQAATAFRAAQAAAVSYAAAAGAAAAGTLVLKAAIKSLLVSTGVGILAVALGAAAEAAFAWGAQTGASADEATAAIEQARSTAGELASAFESAGTAADSFGAKVQAAIKIPNLSIAEIAQDSINSAQSAIAGLAKELGGTVNLPRELVSQFNAIQRLAERANTDMANQRFLLGELVEESNRFADSVRRVTERRQEDIRAAQQAAEASRTRTAELATDRRNTVSPLEQSRLKLAQDLLAIDRERRNAEEALAAARRASDNTAVAAARERLSLIGDAAQAAREQDRQRQLQALGIDNNLLQPAKTIADQFQAIREAANRGLLSPDQLNNAIRNIAREGLEARREIARELSRPSNQALQVSDVRTTQGLSQFLATGRQDPAIEQRREQLARLAEIRRELQNLRNVPVEIRG